MSDIYIQGESLHVDNKVDRVKIEGINETFESLKPKILRVGGGGGGASALSDLSDVDISTPTAGQILRYDEQNDKWVNGEEFLAPVIYSTDEREVGVWIDGKPLYQKTIDCGGLSSGNTTVNHNISNLDRVVAIIGNCKNTSGIMYPIPLVQTGDAPMGYQVKVQVGTSVIVLSTNYATDINSVYVTLQYTKTTDTPGSGTWTPSGIPAVHYDGNEKVIGTWFGETLYEKTYHTGSIDTTNMTIPHGISNIDKIVYAEGYGLHISNLFYNLPLVNSAENGRYAIQVFADATYIYISCISTNQTVDSYVTLRYTKTT